MDEIFYRLAAIALVVIFAELRIVGALYRIAGELSSIRAMLRDIYLRVVPNNNEEDHE